MSAVPPGGDATPPEHPRLSRPVQLVVRESGVADELTRLAATSERPLRHAGESLAALAPRLHVCAYLDDVLVGHAGLVLTSLRHDSGTEDAAGIGHLLVADRRRGYGIGGMLVQSALALAREWDVHGVLAFCDPALDAFYGRYGFSRAGPDVVVGQLGARTSPLPLGLVAMWRPFDGAPGVIGSFELLGLPF